MQDTTQPLWALLPDRPGHVLWPWTSWLRVSTLRGTVTSSGQCPEDGGLGLVSKEEVPRTIQCVRVCHEEEVGKAQEAWRVEADQGGRV